MDYAALKSELTVDFEAYGYSGMTDAQAAESLNAKNLPGQHLVTARTLMSQMNPSTAATILDKLDAAKSADPVLKWTVGFLTGEVGIDLGHANTRAQLDAMAGSVLTQTEVDALKALAANKMSRADVLGLPRVTPGDVQYARYIL